MDSSGKKWQNNKGMLHTHTNTHASHTHQMRECKTSCHLLKRYWKWKQQNRKILNVPKFIFQTEQIKFATNQCPIGKHVFLHSPKNNHIPFGCTRKFIYFLSSFNFNCMFSICSRSVTYLRVWRYLFSKWVKKLTCSHLGNKQDFM